MHASLSPCVGICRLDEATGYCLGCGRTGDEIAAWSTVGPGGRRTIWAALPARLQSLGVRVRRLPWTATDVRSFVIRTLREGTGVWRLAAPGAAASFAAAGTPRELHSHGDVVEAIAGTAALRLRCGAEVQAFAIEARAAAGGAERIALALPAGQPPPGLRAPLPATEPHPDHAAIRPEDRGRPLSVVEADGQGAWWGIRRAGAAGGTTGTGSHARAAAAGTGSHHRSHAQSVAAAATAGTRSHAHSMTAARRDPPSAGRLAGEPPRGDATTAVGTGSRAHSATAARHDPSSAAPAGEPTGGGASADADADVVIESPLGRIEVPLVLADLGPGASPGGSTLPDGFILAAVFDPRL